MNFTKAYSYISYLLVDGVAKLGPFIVLLYLGKNTTSNELTRLESYVIYSNLFVNVLTLGQNAVYITNLYDKERHKYNLKAVILVHFLVLILAFLIRKTEVVYAIIFSLLSFVYNLIQSFENIKGSPQVQRRRDIYYLVIFVIFTIVLSVFLSRSYLLRVLPVLAALFLVVILTSSKEAFQSLQNFSSRILTFPGEVLLLITITLLQWFVVYADKLLLKFWGNGVATTDYFLLTSCMTIQLLICLALLKVVRRDLITLDTKEVYKRFKLYILVSVMAGLLCFSFAILYLGNTIILIDYWSLLPLYFSISIFYFIHTLFLKENKQKNYIKITAILIFLSMITSVLCILFENIKSFHLANTVLYLIMTIILFVNTNYYDTFSSK